MSVHWNYKIDLDKVLNGNQLFHDSLTNTIKGNKNIRPLTSLNEGQSPRVTEYMMKSIPGSAKDNTLINEILTSHHTPSVAQFTRQRIFSTVNPK